MEHSFVIWRVGGVLGLGRHYKAKSMSYEALWYILRSLWQCVRFGWDSFACSFTHPVEAYMAKSWFLFF